MREQILEANYDFWSERNGGIQPEVRAAMENIRKGFSVNARLSLRVFWPELMLCQEESSAISRQKMFL